MRADDARDRARWAYVDDTYVSDFSCVVRVAVSIPALPWHNMCSHTDHTTLIPLQLVVYNNSVQNSIQSVQMTDE